MASAVNSLRLSARLARGVSKQNSRRAFSHGSKCFAAQNFLMPALSPTMTEGNIAQWRVNEGQSFSAGDVLLEIETDKATMDVEAQDDGVLWKIVAGDESKGVKVGRRIAVTAEQGDDLGSLEMPADVASGAGQQTKKEEPASKTEAPKSSEPAPEPRKPAESTKSSDNEAALSAKGQKQTYPLYPAVQHLLHENGLSKEDADTIPASGPNGRLLKGDVLAYLGRIQKDYPAQASARLTKLGHLDLSNIQLATPKESPKEAKKEAAKVPELPKETELAVPISLAAAIAAQKRLQDALGVFLPLSTFIARASELANEDLPSSKETPTSGDLFDAVLGLKSAPKSSKGNYIPQVSMPEPPAVTSPRGNKAPDIIDLLAPRKAVEPRKVRPAAIGVVADGAKVFTVTAKTGEEKRVALYLRRMKLMLETEPGRLVV